MPYNKIVVPLDGSKLAEMALPYVEEIAAGCHVSEIALVSVTENIKVDVKKSEPVSFVPTNQFKESIPMLEGVTGSFMGRMYIADSPPMMKVPVEVGKMAKAAKNYLMKVAANMKAKGLYPKEYVLIGNVVEEIVHFAGEENADLIVMASHGRSGLSHWAIGSVAEKVFRSTTIPVLLVKPKPGFKETKPRRRGKPV